jgi:hypothetical protein
MGGISRAGLEEFVSHFSEYPFGGGHNMITYCYK